MRYKLLLSLVLSAFVLPLPVAGSMATAAGRPDAQGFRILLSDGSILKGSVSFTMNIDSQYGRLTIPSTNFLSARFNIADQWADIYTKGIELRVHYKPASSNLEATTDVGPVNVDLAKVISVETLYAEVPNAASPAASNPYDEGSQAPAPSVIYAATPPAVPQAVPYDYSNAWTYPVYAEPQLYAYPDAYSYVWSPGYGFIAVRSFDRDHHGHHGGFEGRFHNAAAGRAFSSPSFRSTASPAFRSATPTFRSAAPVFRSAAAPAFRRGAATTFHTAAAPSVRSEGMQSGSTRGPFR